MAAPFAVSGTVRDALPSGGTGFTVTGARIEVVAKPGVISTATTDGAGAYRIAGVAGRFQLRVIRTGYETGTVTVGASTTDQKVDIGLVPIPVQISGVVTETAPTESQPIAGARVEVATGSNIGKAVVTDAAGRYTLPGVWGEFTLRITRAGFEDQTNRIVVAGDDLAIDARLRPAAKIIVETFNNPSHGQAGPAFSIILPVHNDGQIAITDFWGDGFEGGDGSILQIWEDGRLAGQMFAERSSPRHTTLLRVPATAGRTYEVRVIRAGGEPSTITVSHPS